MIYSSYQVNTDLLNDVSLIMSQSLLFNDELIAVCVSFIVKALLIVCFNLFSI